MSTLLPESRIECGTPAQPSSRRIALVISSLSAGGAERVVTTMANAWCRQGDRVTILTLHGPQPPFYGLDPEVRYEPLELAADSRSILEALARNLRRIAALRRAIRACRPQFVISFMNTTNVLVVLATRGLGIPVIVSERSDPRLHRIGAIWSALRRCSYWLADRIVFQTRQASARYGALWPGKSVVIPNPVTVPDGGDDPAAATPAAGIPFVLAVGRLSHEKGFDLLLPAFQTASRTHPEWRLVIVGEGPLRQELQRQVAQLGLEGRVDLPGRISNLAPFYHRAALFVLSSRFEGFPNALCEAMACGLPVISIDCPCGPSEIIRDGVDGLLAPCGNAGALAEAMDRLMSHSATRVQMAERASEIVSRFDAGKVMQMWNGLVGELTQ